ncbi:MAG: aspartate-semialdehyde dehydrogenase, partial [Caulobacteraceae bacterium]
VSTYQSVSGAGKEGMDELWDQTKGVFVLGAPEPKKFPKQIAFNVIPFIGAFGDDGYTDEEAKMWNEVHKMIDPAIALTVTCVRVPVMVGHSEAVNVEFHDPIDEDEARDLLRESPGLLVIDQRNDKGYMTPKEAQGEFPVFVSRIRKDPTVENGLNMWVVADNLRKGAALNAVQIAELLHERGLLKTKAIAG